MKISQLAFGAAHTLSGVLPKVPRAQHRLICLNPPQRSTRRPGGAVRGLGASAAQPEGQGCLPRAGGGGIESSSHSALAKGKSHGRYCFPGKTFYLKRRNVKYTAFRTPVMQLRTMGSGKERTRRGRAAGGAGTEPPSHQGLQPTVGRDGVGSRRSTHVRV